MWDVKCFCSCSNIQLHSVNSEKGFYESVIDEGLRIKLEDAYHDVIMSMPKRSNICIVIALPFVLPIEPSSSNVLWLDLMDRLVLASILNCFVGMRAL